VASAKLPNTIAIGTRGGAYLNHPSSQLKAGVAEVDITPELGIQIAGDIGRPRPVEEIRDPLYAKALVLEAGGKRVCIISSDVIMYSTHYADLIRNRIQREFGFEPGAVLLHATQNHSAPSVGHILCRDECKLIPPEYPWLRSGDERYNEVAIEGVVASVAAASKDLSPAKSGTASGVDPRVAFNRRYVMRDGTVRSNPWGPSRLNILHAEGPADPEVGVVALVAPGNKPRALLLHHTCHPTHGYPNRFISADWPGAWSNAMKAECGERCVPLVLNGCCGNILHTNWADAKFVDDQKKMGELLAETTVETMKNVQFQDEVALDYISRIIKIPYRAPTPEELTRSRKMLADYPQPKRIPSAPECVEWDWLFAVSILDLEQKRQENSEFNYEIQAIRMGDTAIVALVGEPFVEGQLEIKRSSPVRHTYIAHMSNGYAGYVPTAHAFRGGGYETWTSNGSQLVPEALNVIASETVKLLNELMKK